MIIELTKEWTKSAAARAVPGSGYSPEHDAWVLENPTPRSATVALKLFPHLASVYPELADLRDAALQDARPVDYATQLDLRIGATRVRQAMAARGWSLDHAKVTPIGTDAAYQARDLGYAAAVLREHNGFYLGWSRGLGKTLGAAALIDELDCGASLIVTPNASKAATWASELEWATPWLHVLVLPDSKKATQQTRVLAEAKERYDAGEEFVLIVHYEALGVLAGRKVSKSKSGRVRKSLGDGWKKLKIHFDLVVADEGHRLANHETIMSRAIGRVQCDRRLVLSGSVFQNRWEEVFGPLHFLFPDRYKAKHRDWCDRYIDYVENGYGQVAVGILDQRLDDMRDELGRFMVVRDKENLAQHDTVHVALRPEQQRVYDDMAGCLLAELPDGTRIKATEGIAILTRLRQIATGLDLLSHEVKDSSKLDKCIDVIKWCWDRGDDYVVFGWYKESLYSLAERLAAEGIEPFVITGDTPQAERDRVIKEFQAGRGRVLLGTIATMGESINLQRANHVIRLDRSWNPATNQQAVDRVDRQGQTREVYLTDIVAEGTVDELVVQPNLANKEALRAVVFGGQV